MVLIILGEAALEEQPGAAPFDEPAFSHPLEALCRTSLDDLQQIAKHRLSPQDQTGLIAAIHEDFDEIGPGSE